MNNDFFLFGRCRRWVQNCRREDLLKADSTYLYNNCRMCDLHFTTSQFMNAETRDQLIKTAVPTIFNFRRVPSTDITDPGVRKPPRNRSLSTDTSQSSGSCKLSPHPMHLNDHSYHRSSPAAMSHV